MTSRSETCESAQTKRQRRESAHTALSRPPCSIRRSARRAKGQRAFNTRGNGAPHQNMAVLTVTPGEPREPGLCFELRESGLREGLRSVLVELRWTRPAPLPFDGEGSAKKGRLITVSRREGKLGELRCDGRSSAPSSAAAAGDGFTNRDGGVGGASCCTGGGHG